MQLPRPRAARVTPKNRVPQVRAKSVYIDVYIDVYIYVRACVCVCDCVCDCLCVRERECVCV